MGRNHRLAKTAFVVVIAFEIAMAVLLVTRLIPEAPPLDPEAPSLEIDEGPLQGIVTIRLQAAEFGVFHLIGEKNAVLGEGSSVEWDTTAFVNGPYTIEARANETVIASTNVEVQNARQELGDTASAVAAATALAAGGSALGSSLASQAALTAAQIGKESLMAVGEDQMAMRSKAKRRMRSRFALGIILLLVFVFFAFEELANYKLTTILAALPIAGGVSAIFVAAAIGGEFLLGWASRVKTRIRFLTTGAISLAVSSVVFRTPFGIPGFVEEIGDEGEGGVEAGESDDDEAPHVEGIRAIASTWLFVTLLLPVLAVGYRWNYAIAEQGLEIALITLATSALPIKPLPGHDVWMWRKSVAILFFLGAFALYFGWALALMPPSVVIWAGILGGVFYAATFTWLRGRSAAPQPAWYHRAVARGTAASEALRTLVPNLARRTSKAIETSFNRLLAVLARVGRKVPQWFAAKLEARRVAKMRAQLQTQAGARAEDLESLVDATDDLDDDDMVLWDGKSVLMGTLRDDAIRSRVYAIFGEDAPAIVTAVPR